MYQSWPLVIIIHKLDYIQQGDTLGVVGNVTVSTMRDVPLTFPRPHSGHHSRKQLLVYIVIRVSVELTKS
jgi:hypothetical protein